METVLDICEGLLSPVILSPCNMKHKALTDWDRNPFCSMYDVYHRLDVFMPDNHEYNGTDINRAVTVTMGS